MTLTVDSRSNSLIVTAPEPLYLEVKDLVAQIDQAGLDQVEDVQVVTLKHTNPEAVQKVLGTILQGNRRSTVRRFERQTDTAAGGSPLVALRRTISGAEWNSSSRCSGCSKCEPAVVFSRAVVQRGRPTW